MSKRFQAAHYAQRFHIRYRDTFERSPPLPYSRTLTAESLGQLPYEKYDVDINTLPHFGQRKLLLSELEFLCVCAAENTDVKCVVYAGAAPGNHIPVLADIFHEYSFILIDPSPFCVQLKDYARRSTGRVKLIQDLFSENVASRLKLIPHGFLFVSDIRNTSVSREEGNNDRVVQQDMDLQRQWVTELRPARSMLKFRLPFARFENKTCVNRDFEYLAGDIYLQAFSRPGSAETRLITQTLAPGMSVPLQTHDCERYEKQMRFFNIVSRPTVWDKAAACGCYDCHTMERIMARVRRERKTDTRRLFTMA